MSTPHRYDVAVFTSATFDLDLITRAGEALAAELSASALQGVELFGRAEAGEIIVLFHLTFESYSAALRKRLEQVADTLKGRLVELSLLSEPDRARLQARLDACDIRPAPGSLAEGVKVLREKMGQGKSGGHVHSVQLEFDSEDGILAAYARFVAEGALFIATPSKLAAGEAMHLSLVAPGLEILFKKLGIGKAGGSCCNRSDKTES